MTCQVLKPYNNRKVATEFSYMDVIGDLDTKWPRTHTGVEGWLAVATGVSVDLLGGRAKMSRS